MSTKTGRAFAVLMAAIATGCANPPTAPSELVLRAADGWVWLTSEQIRRYRCDHGILACEHAIGRMSPRRCRCPQ